MAEQKLLELKQEQSGMNARFRSERAEAAEQLRRARAEAAQQLREKLDAVAEAAEVRHQRDMDVESLRYCQELTREHGAHAEALTAEERTVEELTTQLASYQQLVEGCREQVNAKRAECKVVGDRANEIAQEYDELRDIIMQELKKARDMWKIIPDLEEKRDSLKSLSDQMDILKVQCRLDLLQQDLERIENQVQMS